MGLDTEVKSSLTDLLKKTPGLPLVTAAISSILALAIGQKEDTFGLATLFLIYAAAYVLYRTGSLLDDRVFTPLYGTPRDRADVGAVWRITIPTILAPLKWLVDSLPPTRGLETARTSAKTALGSESDEGLYSTAKQICGRSEEWDDQVKPALNLSKAARSLVIPLFVLAPISSSSWVRSGWVWPGANSPLALRLMTNPWLDLVVATLATFLFIYFRVWHMVALYRLLNPKTITFVDLNTWQWDGRAFVGRASRMLASRDRLLCTKDLSIYRDRNALPNHPLNPTAAGTITAAG